MLDADKLSQSKDFPCFGLPEGVHTEGSQKPKVLGKKEEQRNKSGGNFNLRRIICSLFRRSSGEVCSEHKKKKFVLQNEFLFLCGLCILLQPCLAFDSAVRYTV